MHFTTIIALPVCSIRNALPFPACLETHPHPERAHLPFKSIIRLVCILQLFILWVLYFIFIYYILYLYLYISCLAVCLPLLICHLRACIKYFFLFKRSFGCGPFLKSLSNFLQYCFCFMFCFFPPLRHMASLVPDQWSHLHPLNWKVKSEPLDCHGSPIF